MGKFLSPPFPLEYATKCALVIYPDDEGAFFLNAIRGALYQLTKSYMWEGTLEEAREVAQIWRDYDRETDGMFFKVDCEDVPFIIGDEDLNINIDNTCNCNVSGGGGATLVCYGIDGEPIINPGPITEPPNQPPILTEPLDPEQPIPPELPYEDWGEFDAKACDIANSIWRDVNILLSMLEAMTDIAAILAAVIVVILGAIPVSWATAIGAPVIYRIGLYIMNLIAGEEILDQLNSMRLWWTAHKESIVCGLYDLRHDTDGLYQNFLQRVNEMLLTVLFDSPITPWLIGKIIMLALPAWLIWKWMLGEEDPPLDLEPFDCSDCGTATPSGLRFFNQSPGSVIRYTDGTPIEEPHEILYGQHYTIESHPCCASWNPQRAGFAVQRIDTSEFQATEMDIVSVSSEYAPKPDGDSDNEGYKLLSKDVAGNHVGELHDGHPPATGTKPPAREWYMSGHQVVDTYFVEFVLRAVA